MIRWKFNCPYCHATLMRGTGYDKGFPEIGVPFFRCSMCGQLISTGSREYINIPLEERLEMRPSLKNSEAIASSLDRTNNKAYRKFLSQNEFEFEPLTDLDRERFENVNWHKYENRDTSSVDATKNLYDLGILIREDCLDNKTGGIKKEIIDENQRNYRINQVSIAFGSVAGIIVGGLFGGLLSSVSSADSYLPILCFPIGFLVFFLTAALTSSLLHKTTNNESSNTKNIEYPNSLGKSSNSTLDRINTQNELPSPWDALSTNQQDDISSISDSDQDDCDYHLCPECGWEVFDDEERCSVCGRKNEKKLDCQTEREEHKNVYQSKNPNGINISLSKQKKLSQMFGIDYGDIIQVQETQINDKKGLLYLFNPEKISTKNSFYAIFELNTKKHRYFALEEFFSLKTLQTNVYALFEWTRDENSNRTNRRIVGDAIKIINDEENPIERMIEYIQEDICQS